jgi:hypothetical protein
MSTIENLDRTFQVFDGLFKKYQTAPINGAEWFNASDCNSKNAMQVSKIIVNKERKQRLYDLAQEVKSNLEFLKDCPLTLAENEIKRG